MVYDFVKLSEFFQQEGQLLKTVDKLKREYTGS